MPCSASKMYVHGHSQNSIDYPILSLNIEPESIPQDDREDPDLNLFKEQFLPDFLPNQSNHEHQ